MQDASSGRRGWPKKSKLTVEEGGARAGSIAEDDFSSPEGHRSDSISDGLGGFDSNVDGNEEHKL